MSTYYIYDDDGFLSGTTEDAATPRCTSIEPPEESATHKANFVGTGWVLIDMEDRASNLAARQAESEVAAARQSILNQIEAIEASVTQRRLREAVLTENGATWLSDRESEIAALRAQL